MRGRSIIIFALASFVYMRLASLARSAPVQSPCDHATHEPCYDTLKRAWVCRNLEYDDENCGSCGYTCPVDLMCDLGRCVNATDGNGDDRWPPVMIRSTLNHHGQSTCNCDDELRTADYRSRLLCCPLIGRCVDITKSNDACGACDVQCAAGSGCVDGVCVRRPG